MNVNNYNSIKANKQNNNICHKTKFNNFQNKENKKAKSSKNKYQSDKKLKKNHSPYNIIHKKLTSDLTATENQKILLQKRELEIKDLKIKCQKLEQENHMYQLQNVLLKNNFINSKKDSGNNLLLGNNTSSNFPIINEIKKIWENLAKVELLNNFIEFENEPEIIYHLICQLFLLSDKMIKEHCQLKYQEIIKIMGVKNNSVIIKDIEAQFKTFMKEHLTEIFNYLQDKSFINEYKNLLKDVVKNSIKCVSDNEDNIKIFEEILEQNEFNDMMKNINDLILFTQFNDPTLYFKIESKYEDRKMKYIKIRNENKNEYIIINGQGKSNCIIDALVLLEPPCIKSGYAFYNELKPILMAIQKDVKEDINDNNNNITELKENEEKGIDNKIKYNSLNNTSRAKRNLKLDIISNIKNNEYNYKNFYTCDNNTNKKKYFIIKKDKIINYDVKSLDKNYFLTNKKIEKIISINSSRAMERNIKKIKNISISKDAYSDYFCSSDDNYHIDNKQLKEKNTIQINKPLDIIYNKIHRIKSVANYFDKNNKIVNQRKRKESNLLKDEELNKIYNNYKQYIMNNVSKNIIFKKNRIITSPYGNQSLSNRKKVPKQSSFRKNMNTKNKRIDKKNYNSTSNNKINSINMNNVRKRSILIDKYNQKSVNECKLKNSKTKTNLKSNNNLYKNSFLIIKKSKSKDIISPLKSIRANKDIEKSKDTLISEGETSKKRRTIKNIINHKNKMQNIKINYSNYNSNRNILINKVQTNYSNLSSNRAQPKEKRLDSFDQKNSFLYSTLEDIRKILDDTHKPIIMISNSNNNNTNDVNDKLKIRYHKFNQKKKIIRPEKKNKCNTINNSIKQLVSLPKQKINENAIINYNNIAYNDNKKNTNLFIQNNCINNCLIYYKQFSIDETTFNTSNQFNNTNDYNININKNYNQFVKVPKNKENTTSPIEKSKTKYKSSYSKNMNSNKNKIREIEINIDGLSNNKNIDFNTINIQRAKNIYHNFFHSYE